jgi:hypothetical protein
MSDGWLIDTCHDCFGDFLERGEFAQISAAIDEAAAFAAQSPAGAVEGDPDDHPS